MPEPRPDPIPEALPQGTQMAGFVLDNPLGRGGFGITYRAQSKDGKRVYAVKEYFPADVARRTPDGTVLAREGDEASRLFEIGRRAFLDEAFVLRDLPRQPGLVQVRGAFERNGTAYCLMDFIAGESLDRVVQRLLQRHGHVPEPPLCDLVSTLCRALGAVHGAGFVHCDIKPSNIMINKAGTPVLIDFGAARRLDQSQDIGAMLSGRYAALEQFPNPPRIGRLAKGPWTDLFSLSVMLYEIVTQSAPPNARQRASDVAAGRRDPYLPARENLWRNRVEIGYSATLLDLIDRGCALLPEHRPQSAADYRRPIELLRPAQPPALPPEDTTAVPTGAPLRPGHRKPQRDPFSPPVELGKVATMLIIIFGLAGLATVLGLLPNGATP